MKLWKITNTVLVIVLVALLWVFVFGMYSNQPGANFNKGHNAIWIGHQWVGNNKSDREIQQLVNTLTKHQIDTVFVHSGPLGEDGDIDVELYEHAEKFLLTARRFNPDIQYQAWLGQVRSKIPLEEAEVRSNIANQCMILTKLVGFDGIHFDIEPVWDKDTEFLEMMKECRSEIDNDKVISVALAEFIPESFIWALRNVKDFHNYNSEVSYQNISKLADQIVVMAYDTGMKQEWMYSLLVEEQTIRIINMVSESEIFMGLPAYAYDDPKPSFDPEVENIESGLKGVIKALNNIRSNEEQLDGVAIYPYWEMDEEEWQTFDKLWLNR